ncbi:MAG: hypothetical protein DI604_37135, partial [Delftia acidovorans]
MCWYLSATSASSRSRSVGDDGFSGPSIFFLHTPTQKRGFKFIGLLRKATFKVLVHAEHHFFEFRVTMAPVCNLGEDDRIDHFRKRRFEVSTLVENSARAFLRVDTEGASRAKPDRINSGLHSDKKPFLIVNADEEGRDGLKIEIKPHSSFTDVRTGEHNRFVGWKHRPARQRIKLQNHWLRSFLNPILRRDRENLFIIIRRFDQMAAEHGVSFDENF